MTIVFRTVDVDGQRVVRFSPPNIAIKPRRDTAANWTEANTLLLHGETAFERDTGRMKVGDGVTPWNDLPYMEGRGRLVLLPDETLGLALDD